MSPQRHGTAATSTQTVHRTVPADGPGLQVLSTAKRTELTLPPRCPAGDAHCPLRHVINVSSILGLVSFPGWVLHCAAKYALDGLFESVAAEVADPGIRVMIVEPGYFDSDFLTSNLLAPPETIGDADRAIREVVAVHQNMPGTRRPGHARRCVPRHR